MKKHLFAFALLVFALLPILASAKYIGPDPPKGCTTCGCSTCGCGTCGGAPSRSMPSNTSSAISATEGNMTERVPVSTVGATLGLAFVYNTYNADGSRATVDTVMGYGWTHSFNVFLFSQAGVMFRWDGEGRVTRYGLGPGAHSQRRQVTSRRSPKAVASSPSRKRTKRNIPSCRSRERPFW
jgi:hypothetical protein